MTYADLRRALEIVVRARGSAGEHLPGADHDTLYLCDADVPFTDDDRAELERLGVILDARLCVWRCYV